MPPKHEVEEQIQQIAAELRHAAGKHGQRRRPEDRFLDRVLQDTQVHSRLLQFVDVLPTLSTAEAIAGHLDMYLGDTPLPVPWPKLARWALHQARRPVAAELIALTVRTMTRRLARRFIAGENFDQVLPDAQHLWNQGIGFVLDVLGEATTGEAAAARYQKQYLDIIAQLPRQVARWDAMPLLDRAGMAPTPRAHLAVKASSLHPHLTAAAMPAVAAELADRLRPIFSAARQANIALTLDMEQFDTREIIFSAFQTLLMEDEFRSWAGAGIAVQAYQRDAAAHISHLIAWARARGTAITVRLVRGAYWDYEMMLARQNNWPEPVWAHKPETDACYDQCLSLLLSNHPSVRTAVATHNLRSIALALALEQNLGLRESDYEFQMLYGMAEDFRDALARRGAAVRVYMPYGQLLPGIAYLVRRLLENSSSNSLQRLQMRPDSQLTNLQSTPAARPAEQQLVIAPAPALAQAGDPVFANEPPRRFALPEVRTAFVKAIGRVRGQMPFEAPLMIGTTAHKGLRQEQSVNPAQPDMLVARIAWAGPAEAQQAVTAAAAALPAWSNTPVEQRAALLRRAADWLANRRDEMAAWEIFEAGKPWAEADGDVCEAIDFLRYYATEAVRLFSGRRLDVPGEANCYFYQPRGVAAIIAPWNFPLAIITGMTAAALVCGNTVVLKPAPQTPLMGWWLYQALTAAGVESGVVNYVPGGDDAGCSLVDDSRINLIAFTGSEAAGCSIFAAAAQVRPGQRHLKRVIAEMGGKNAIIVDQDADLDEAVVGIVASAFGYCGQKCSACSRVICVGGMERHLTEQLIDRVASLRIGPPEDPANLIGPVIDAEARQRIARAVERGRSEAQLLWQAPRVPDVGFFSPPCIFSGGLFTSQLNQEEIFGPVLSLLHTDTFEQALLGANQVRFALTGGVYSRHPEHLDQARRAFCVGNLYLNRHITGAIVGRQPFGGSKMSGIGSKAGGPDYLLQFVEPRTITENVVRHGFVPPLEKQTIN